ncbi:Ig domain-containing protein [Streptomyces sp. NPDC048603]|uniref:Ig domain-containing protein n=1 Tax=Streptomyces sp. NPDC048603 TaxID=3365577 RepID=UPI00370F85FD
MRNSSRAFRRGPTAALVGGLAVMLALAGAPAHAAAPAAEAGPAVARSTAAAAIVVANPGTQTGYQYDSVSLQMTASGGTTPYTWSAVNLPTGTRIDPATGKISGFLRGAGTRTVTVTATDTSGNSGSTSFTWRVIRDACPRC